MVSRLLAALGLGEQVVAPDTVGIGLEELVTSSAGAHADPRRTPAPADVEAVRSTFDEIHHSRHRFFPAARPVQVQAPHRRDMLMRAVAVRFGYGITRLRYLWNSSKIIRSGERQVSAALAKARRKVSHTWLSL
jgi:hypothetical protein